MLHTEKDQLCKTVQHKAKQTCLKDKHEVGEPFCEHCGK